MRILPIGPLSTQLQPGKYELKSRPGASNVHFNSLHDLLHIA
ncbi:hypothetical protein [Rubidibacter lacunae]|nr:hypothetical protein [Rubidibacter lacunae]